MEIGILLDYCQKSNEAFTRIMTENDMETGMVPYKRQLTQTASLSDFRRRRTSRYTVPFLFQESWLLGIFDTPPRNFFLRLMPFYVLHW